ncbi:MAG: DUF934 domain-containing protein [Rhodobacteraceae bacterium]|nr:DUF934 domain-containing protein [Paracoccaceae bacterium]
MECGIHFANDIKQVPDASVIVSDNGFASDDWNRGFLAIEELEAASNVQKSALAIDLPNDFEATDVLPLLDQIDLIRIDFPVFSDGRGFSLAQRLRLLAYRGRLRAKGHVLADQYAMARRSGFDEVEIDKALAARQPESQWLARADWQARNYQHRFQQSA